MQCKEIISTYLTNLEGGFFCREHDNRLWIISPYSYPDGDLIEVAMQEGPNDRVLISDLGETFRHLSDLGFDPRSTQKGEYLIKNILKRFNIEIEKGQIFKRASRYELGEIMFDVVSACFAMADLIYLSRAYQPATFQEEVAHFFIDHNVVYEKKYSVIGSTGTSYTVDFYFPHVDGEEGMLKALSPKGSQGMKPSVDATFRLWSDVGNSRWLGTLLDDRVIHWKSEDIKLLKRVCRVHFWQQRDKLLDELLIGK